MKYLQYTNYRQNILHAIRENCTVSVCTHSRSMLLRFGEFRHTLMLLVQTPQELYTEITTS